MSLQTQQVKIKRFKNGLTAKVTFGLCFQAEDVDE